MPIEKTPLALAPLLARFASESAMIRRLALSDQAFRGIVEDFLLAHVTLSDLKRQPVAERAKIKEYADLVDQLEQDVRKYLARLNMQAP
jgi:hypothetical protein